MLALPRTVLDMLNLRAGDSVGLTVDKGRLILEPAPRPKYTMEELLAASDYTDTRGDDREWVDGYSVGREMI